MVLEKMETPDEKNHKISRRMSLDWTWGGRRMAWCWSSGWKLCRWCGLNMWEQEEVQHLRWKVST
jgi:hypothetical protein